MGEVYRAHSTRADGREDFVRPQTSPSGQRHDVEQFYFTKQCESPRGGLHLKNDVFGVWEHFKICFRPIVVGGYLPWANGVDLGDQSC
jgi:hypothetical protein